MECNKEEAMRAKEIAENRMINKDFLGARKFALKAQQLCPDLDSISHMILVCEVHISSQNKIFNNEKDWYSILNIDQSADESSIKKQYRKYALSLHPDKNSFSGSIDAFKLIGEAQMVLLDRDKRAIYDSKYKAKKVFDAKKEQPKQQGKSGFSNEKSTFWTLCPSCCIKYRFPADLVDKSVWCKTCKMYFIGREIKVEAAPVKKKEKKPKKWYPKKSSTPKQEYQVNINSENNGSVKRARESVQARESSENNKKFKSFEKCTNVGLKTHEGDVEFRPHKYTQSKISTYYNTRSADGKFSKQETPLVEKADNHFTHVKPRENNFMQGDEKRKGEIDNKKRKIQSKNYDQKSIFDVYQYPDPDFSNFDEYRMEECFQTGQVWAVYDTIDAMPRFYALIKEIISPHFKLVITWLEPNPENKDQETWMCEGLPVSCGRFKNGESEIVEDRLMFSHLLCYEKENGSDIFRIFPKKGETWALFKNWDRDQDFKNKIELEYVEILSDYDEDTGVFVAYLAKAKGYLCLFTGMGVNSFRILPEQLFRFSHQVPSFRMSGEEREDVPEGSFELDPASLSPNLEEIDNRMENFPILEGNMCFYSDFSNFNTSRTDECFSVGQIWALYDLIDSMPRFYARIKEVYFSPIFEVRLTWLEPKPKKNEEIKWVNEGLPVSCGEFKLGNCEKIKDHLMFSHLVFQEKVSEKETYRIYPREGETWALFKDWDMKWNLNLEGKMNYSYEFVEILSDYDGEIGVSVAYLDKVEGYSCLFCRAENENKSFEISPNDIFRFSHRIPSFRVNDKEQRDVPKGSFELDPGSLPSFLK